MTTFQKSIVPRTCSNCKGAARGNRKLTALNAVLKNQNREALTQARDAKAALAVTDAALEALEAERRAQEADRVFIVALAERLGWGPCVDWETHEAHIMDRVERLLHLEEMTYAER